MPKRLEGIFNSKYLNWKEVEHNQDGSARYMPAGLRTLEAALLREYPPEETVACYPNDLERFIGPRTRLVAVSTHNPLGVTFAAGVYASIFGSSQEPINSHYARQLFDRIKANPHRSSFKVIVGGSGGWLIIQTDSYGQLRVDCVAEGRGESPDTMEIKRRGLFAVLVPSIFTPLHDTRMEKKRGVTQTRELTGLQWQLMMKCWRMNLTPGLYS